MKKKVLAFQGHCTPVFMHAKNKSLNNLEKSHFFQVQQVHTMRGEMAPRLMPCPWYNGTQTDVIPMVQWHLD